MSILEKNNGVSQYEGVVSNILFNTVAADGPAPLCIYGDWQ